MAAPLTPADYRAIWDKKPVLRLIYEDIYRRMAAELTRGRTLEIGGGSGNFKAFAPDTLSSDIVPAPWLDLVCDAQRLPFASGSFDNVVMVDVLHHIEFPVRALREIVDVLRPGGRFIMCEPAITPVSGLFYRNFHPEPVDMTADPLADGKISPDKDPFDSNQAIPTLLTGRDRERLSKAIPELQLQSLGHFSFVAYPLSGGFRPWSLIPLSLAKSLLSIEWKLRKVFGRIAAFRLLAVYEKIR
ncbi:class I SAM-dependent methyltransferase [Pseudorhodoplanes sp.]|uniref:class I SAM-dependent methyltransferase n=1 Tax=Pseudorhodoplanes sp. TaxID=1934341 RepID=UPI002C4333CD|nr:methyltransferase domain-containing protein [Pseudorhodoplanes sp.]HWV54426.1 methyltransferase domain-containing protein [Pseudorhodoplanes sp.]